MQITISKTRDKNGAAAADLAAQTIRETLQTKGRCRLILATGASQFEMLESLTAAPNIDWGKVTLFHLDEYIGLPDTHPASFRRYMLDRVVAQVPTLGEFVGVQGDAADPEAECQRLGVLLRKEPIDLACIGIGENGHLAFNDPPADFETEASYLPVNLDMACRRQQMGEGWFKTIDDVPARAITMGIRQIMRSARLVVTVPDERKAEAVRNTLVQAVNPRFPSTILRTHPDCTLFIDQPAASLLSEQERSQLGGA